MLIDQPGSMKAIKALCRKHRAIWELQRGVKLSDDALANWGPEAWVRSAIREAYLLGVEKGMKDATHKIP